MAGWLQDYTLVSSALNSYPKANTTTLDAGRLCCLTSSCFIGHCFREVASFVGLCRFALFGPTTLEGGERGGGGEMVDH